MFDGSTEIGSKGEASVHQAEVAIRLGKLINAYMYILNPTYYKFLTICISHIIVLIDKGIICFDKFPH